MRTWCHLLCLSTKWRDDVGRWRHKAPPTLSAFTLSQVKYMTLQTGNKLTQTIYEYFEQYKLFTSNISITIKKQLWHSVPAQISPHLKWSRLCRNMIGWQESARQPITVNHSIWIRQRQLTEILSWLPWQNVERVTERVSWNGRRNVRHWWTGPSARRQVSSNTRTYRPATHTCNTCNYFNSSRHINPFKPMGTLKPQSNRPLYSNSMVTGTLAVDGWAVTFGTARRGLGRLQSRPVPSSLYQI